MATTPHVSVRAREPLRDHLIRSLRDGGMATEYDLMLTFSTRSRPNQGEIHDELIDMQAVGLVRSRECSRSGAKARIMWELIA